MKEFGHVQFQGATWDRRHQIVARFQSRFRENSVYHMITAAKSHATLKQPVIARVMHARGIRMKDNKSCDFAGLNFNCSFRIQDQSPYSLLDSSWATSDVSGSTFIFPDVRAESVEVKEHESLCRCESAK